MNRLPFLLHLVRLTLLIWVLGNPFMASHAQPSGAVGEHFLYRIVKDDTLIDLAQRYTLNAQNWQTLQELNQVAEPTALPIGRMIRIPFSLIPEEPAQASIAHLRGQASLNGRPAQVGQVVNEGDTLVTHPGSFLTLALPDGGESSLPGATTMHLDRLRTFTGTGLVDAIIRLETGSLEASVAPEDQGTGRYEIRTPVSITGVRGTHLRVRLDAEHHTYNEVLKGTAQLGQDAADGPQLASNQGTIVDPGGTIQPVRPLLPAPQLAEALDGAQLNFTPVEGAAGYEVRTAADPLGTRPFSVQTVTQPPVTVNHPGTSVWYVLVRAIDEHGLMSADATLRIKGGHVLKTRYGLVVQDGGGQAVQLSAY